LLKRTYEEYFTPSDNEPQVGRKLEDYQNLPHFERLLANVCAVEQRLVPNLFVALEVAEATMSTRFCRAFAGALMEFDWASPRQWPELPIVGPDRVLEGETTRDKRAQRVEMIVPIRNRTDSQEATLTYRRASPFYISCLPEGEGRKVSVNNPWQWEHEPTIRVHTPLRGQPRVWPPDDFLLFGTAFQAGRVAHSAWNERQVEPFEGSLLDGVDIKTTLRASIRGEKRIYVRRNPLTAEAQEAHGSGLEPTVFIFAQPRTDDNASWFLYSGSMTRNIREHIKNLSRFDEVVRDKGDHLVEGVGFVECASIPSQLTPYVIGLNLLRGIMVFESPCLNAVQEARWLEETDYARSPIFRGGGMRELISMYRQRHRIKLDFDDWTTTLVLLAIPYAKHRVIVVAPDHFIFRPIIFQEARRHRVHLAVLPLSYFPSERIEKLIRQYTVQPEDKDGMIYPDELERLLGQSANAFSDLLPRHLIGQGVVDRS
jgi:hypothetical protein